MSCAETARDCVLYVDDELAAPERQAFEAHLEHCAACRAVVTRERERIAELRRAAPLYKAPKALQDRLLRRLQGTASESQPRPVVRPPTNRVVRRMVGYAALAMVLLAAVGAERLWGWFVPQPRMLSDAGFEIVAAGLHQRYLAAKLPLDVESDSPDRLAQWFSEKLPFGLRLPNYPEQSALNKPYRLRGGRLVAIDNHDAAYVAYEMHGMPISLLAIPADYANPSGTERIAFQGLDFFYRAVGDLNVITWSHRGLTYALVSAFEDKGQRSCLVCHNGTDQGELLERIGI